MSISFKQHSTPETRKNILAMAASHKELTEKLDALVRAASTLRNMRQRDHIAVAKLEGEIDRARKALGFGSIEVRL